MNLCSTRASIADTNDLLVTLPLMTERKTFTYLPICLLIFAFMYFKEIMQNRSKFWKNIFYLIIWYSTRFPTRAWRNWAVSTHWRTKKIKV